MAIIQCSSNTAIDEKIKKYYKALYDGKLTYPCDEDCPDGCNGDHYYELPVEFPPLFEVPLAKKTKK